MSNFNIHVTYGTLSKVFSCSSRREFGSKVSKFFGLDKSEMQMFEINKQARNPITINDLADNMKIEIKKNGIPSASNGERLRASDHELIKVPNLELLKEKLTGNSLLADGERKFLYRLIEDFDNISSTSRKRKRGPEEEVTPKEMVNKKVQVDLGAAKHSTYSQTDPLIAYDPDKPSTSKDLISESKRLARAEKKDTVKVRQLMNDTFESRRHFILLKNPVLIAVKEKYPLLFSTDEVRNELNRIFYDKKDEEFLTNIKNCSSVILSLIDEDKPLVKVINNAVDAAKSSTQKSYAKQVGALLMISNLLREKRTYLNTEDEPCEKNNYPRIEAPCEVSKLFADVNTYRIIVEGIVLCEASTFPEAVLCLLSCYFIFNIQYPEPCFNTFVVMEKVFLDANDTDINDIDEQTSQIIRLIKLKTHPKS